MSASAVQDGWKLEVARLKQRLADHRQASEAQRLQLVAALADAHDLRTAARRLAESLAECAPDPLNASELQAAQARRAGALELYGRLAKA